MTLMYLDDDNPFASCENYTSLMVHCDQRTVPKIDELFADEALSVSHFEREKGSFWQMDILLPEKHTKHMIAPKLENIEGIHKWEVSPLEMQDWVLENQKDFPPLEIGQFYIHGSHLQPKADKLSLKIDAGRAFGTGEHATTAGCLLAMQWLHEHQEQPNNIADIGCGTGILALAAQMLWPNSQIIGSDMDEPSVDTAIENASENHIGKVEFITASGMDHSQLQKAVPFDLLIANILANPLIELAEDLTSATHPQGHIILSGLLIRQQEEVLEAYQQYDWHLQRAIHRDEWSAMILKKGGA